MTRLLANARFSAENCGVIPLLHVGYQPGSFSAGLIGFIAAFVPGPLGLTEPDAQAWAEGLEALGNDYFFSLNRYLFLATKPGAPA